MCGWYIWRTSFIYSFISLLQQISIQYTLYAGFVLDSSVRKNHSLILSIFLLLWGADKQRGEIRIGSGGEQSHYERSTRMGHLLQPCRVRKGCPEEAMSMGEPNSWIEVWKMELQMKGGGRMRMEEWPRKSEQDSMWVQQPECESKTKAREASGDQTTQSLCSIGKTNW